MNMPDRESNDKVASVTSPVFFPDVLGSEAVLGAMFPNGFSARSRVNATLLDTSPVFDEAAQKIFFVRAPGRTVPGFLLLNLGEDDVERIRFFFRSSDEPHHVQLSVEGKATSGYCFNVREENENHEEQRQKEIKIGGLFQELTRRHMSWFGRSQGYSPDRIWRGLTLRLFQERAVSQNIPLNPLSTLSGQSVELLRAEEIFQGYVSITDLFVRHAKFGGGKTDLMRRTVVGWGDAVSVIPFDPSSSNVLLVEQFRPGSLARGERDPWCIGVIAGRLDRPESLEDAVRREAREEAGLIVGRLDRLAQYYSSPGISSELITCFAAEANLVARGGVFGETSENEDIRSFVLSIDEAIDCLLAGDISVGHAYIALLTLKQREAEIRERWR